MNDIEQNDRDDSLNAIAAGISHLVNTDGLLSKISVWVTHEDGAMHMTAEWTPTVQESTLAGWSDTRDTASALIDEAEKAGAELHLQLKTKIKSAEGGFVDFAFNYPEL